MKSLSLIMMTIVSFSLCSFSHAQTQPNQIKEKLSALEKTFDGKIGVYALNTNNNQIIAYRAEERFPVQSTMKVIGVSALLKMSEHNKNLLYKQLNYTQKDLMFWHPLTGKYLKKGMTLDALAEAAITYSDNPAMNLIMKKMGGPKSVSSFARSIGNPSFNVSHYEGDLNSNPLDYQDTSTPKDMATSLEKLTLGNALAPSLRAKLIEWMRNDTVGYKRIRSGVPGGWIVADKTGSGDYGIANDIGILWSPLCKPIVLAIYTVQNKPNAKRREDIVATTTSLILDEFAKSSSCFAELNA